MMGRAHGSTRAAADTLPGVGGEATAPCLQSRGAREGAPGGSPTVRPIHLVAGGVARHHMHWVPVERLQPVRTSGGDSPGRVGARWSQPARLCGSFAAGGIVAAVDGTETATRAVRGELVRSGHEAVRQGHSAASTLPTRRAFMRAPPGVRRQAAWVAGIRLRLFELIARAVRNSAILSLNAPDTRCPTPSALQPVRSLVARTSSHVVSDGALIISSMATAACRSLSPVFPIARPQSHQTAVSRGSDPSRRRCRWANRRGVQLNARATTPPRPCQRDQSFRRRR